MTNLKGDKSIKREHGTSPSPYVFLHFFMIMTLTNYLVFVFQLEILYGDLG